VTGRTWSMTPWLRPNERSVLNFFFPEMLEEFKGFADRCTTIRNRAFWEIADRSLDQYAREQPVLSGLFDRNCRNNRWWALSEPLPWWMLGSPESS